MKYDSFHYKDGELYCEQVPVREMAENVGTPFYCYSCTHLEKRFREYDSAFGSKPHLICFAVKANSNLAVLNWLARLGSGADIVSGGELFRALRAGIPAERIVYSGVGKTADEIHYALEKGILMFNTESLEELGVISELASRENRKARISIRVNPDVDPKTHPYISTGLKKNKFGLSLEQAMEAYDRASKSPWLNVVGIACHIGSQILETEPFVSAFEKVKELLARLGSTGINLSYVDLGGGLGISYGQETPPEPAEYVGSILERAKWLGQTIIVEPGRAICGNSGILVTRLLYRKKGPVKTFYVVDAAMNDLGRPSLYDAYHEIMPVSRDNDREEAMVDVVGPICETGDFLARERKLPVLSSGELLAIMSAGAYGFTMSSNYNSRPRVAEVMVKGGRFEIVRQRETYQDLVKGEDIPEWED